MILIYAPYPFPDQVRGGWMRRISVVDELFKDRPRFYVFPANSRYAKDPSDYRLAESQIEEHAWFAWLDFRFSLHHRRLTELVEKCDFVYAHTCHSAQHMLPYYRTGKVVTDVHGIAPEEEAMQGRPDSAAFFATFEETMARESAMLVTVTETMADHYRAKYPGLTTRFVNMPIVDAPPDSAALARPPRARPRAIYSGGLQEWQRFDRMLEVMAGARDRDYAIYTDAVAEAERRARAGGVAAEVRWLAPDELADAYRDADFGFVLRADSPVNRVACPTKLSEYLAFGVVPVVELSAIGDFERLGYEFVTAEDFAAGRLPDGEELEAMRRRNRDVFERIHASYESGKRELQELGSLPPRVDMRRRGSAFLTTLERTFALPLRGARLTYERGGERREVALDDQAHASRELEVSLPGAGALTAFRYTPMDAPFVTTPVTAEVVSAGGRAAPVRVRGNHRHDRFGNWIFASDPALVTAKGLDIDGAARLRLRFEVLLWGPESHVARPSRAGRLRKGGGRQQAPLVTPGVRPRR